MLLRQAGNTVEVISDYGEVLVWNMSIFGRTGVMDSDDIFSEINGYLNRKTEEQRARIWTAYVKARHAIEFHDRPDVLLDKLADCVNDIYNEIPMDDLDHYIRHYINVRYPATLLDTHSIEDMTPDKTYIRSDYHGLVLMSVYLRPMVPIWGEYLIITKKNSGNQWKEYEGVKILRDTEIQRSEPMERLCRYIEAMIKNEVGANAVLVKGMSSVEFPNVLLAIIMIRRLGLGEVDDQGKDGSIISNIFTFVNNQIGDFKKASSTVREKIPEGGDDRTDQQSHFERYRMNTEATPGDKQKFNACIERWDVNARALAPDIDINFVKACVDHAITLQGLDITDTQIQLYQWVMRPVITPYAIPAVSFINTLRVAGTVQAVLMHWGFTELALLATSQGQYPEGGTIILNDTSRSRVPDSVVLELDNHYPLRNSEEIGKPKNNNITYLHIMELCKEFGQRYWFPNIPPVLRDHKVPLKANNRLPLPSTLPEMIVNIAIRVANM